MNLRLPLLVSLASASCATPSAELAARPIVLASPADGRALVVVRVPPPWWAPRFLITSRFVDSVPEYARLPGLEHKAYTFAEDGRFGGVYLWTSRAAAEAHFGPSWHDRVRRERGVEGEVRILDVRWTEAGEARPEGTALPLHDLRTGAAVTWLTGAPGADPTRQEALLEALASAHGAGPGLVRVSFTTESDGRVGAVALWASRPAAEAFWTVGRLARAGEALGGAADLTWFDAPVLLDAAAAKGVAR